MIATVRQSIQEFLAARRIAVIGVSRDSRHMSRSLFRELRNRGYDVVPVNPQATDMEGVRCYPRVADIQPGVDAALLFTTGAVTDQVVGECAAAGVHCVWMYRGGGQGAVTESAVELCREKGMSVVPGECPYMFLSGSGWVHSLHGLLRRAFGTYPAA